MIYFRIAIPRSDKYAGFTIKINGWGLVALVLVSLFVALILI